MIKQASVKSVRNGSLNRKDGHLVATMCFYPRGLPKELLDEYLSSLAPDRTLFSQWKIVERREGHDQAFVLTEYEKRFLVTDKLLYHLARLADLARAKDVFLLCQCEKGERCHREMLMLLAQQNYKVKIDKVFHDYPEFLRRFT